MWQPLMTSPTSRSRTTFPIRCSPEGPAHLQVRAGEIPGQGHRRQLRQGSDGRAVADLEGDRRRVDAARAGRDARAALARHGRRMGLRPRGAGPHHGHRSAGDSETNDFDPGDIWYFPRGHGHMLECLGDEPCHFILIFDNGYFSEFGTFSITDWLGHTPKALLAKNFGLPESAFDGFPMEEVYFARGPVPPEDAPPASGRAEVAARDAQVPAARPGAAFDPQGRARVAGRRRPVPDLEDDHRRDPRPRAGRLARAALAPQRRRVAVRHRGPSQRHPVRLARPLPDRDAGQGRRRLHPPGLRPLDREHRRQAGRVLIGFNTGRLPGDRPVPVDGRHPGLCARQQLRQAAVGLREVPEDPMGAIGSILLSGRVRVLNHPRGSDHASPLSSTSRTPCYPH